MIEERLAESVGPGSKDDRIELSPGDHRGLTDPRVLEWGARFGLPLGRASTVVGDARLDRSGARVDIDNRIELALADRLLPAAPVIVEVLEIQAHGLPVVGDEPIGPGQGVKMLVPELALHRWIEPSSADARVGRIEQGQRPDAVGMTTSQVWATVAPMS